LKRYAAPFFGDTVKKNIVLSLLISIFAFANDPWNGAEYNKNSEEQKAAAKRTLSTLNFSGDEKVLDIGCGDGYLTSLIAGQVSDVVGIDLSPSMIMFAEGQYGDDHLHFRVLDARLLDYENQFDLITSFTTLQWVPEQLTVLQGIEKALCSGGKMIIDMPTALPKPMLQAVEEKMALKQWNSYFEEFVPGWRFFTANEYEGLLDQTTLQAEMIVQTPVPFTFPSKQAFMSFLKQFLPYLRPLPEDQKMLFLEQVVDRYLELMPPTEPGRPTFIVNRLHVEAMKP
jgi:trans-aconitate 2-methyltransferase